MLIEQTKIEAIFDELAINMRSKVNQTRDSIVQDSHRRLASHPHDEPARHLIAAARLNANDPERCLRLLLDFSPSSDSAIRQ